MQSALPSLVDLIIARAKRTPYFDLADYMGRFWLREHNASRGYAEKNQIAMMLKLRVVILLPEDGTIAVKAGYPPEDVLDEADAEGRDPLTGELVAGKVRGARHSATGRVFMATNSGVWSA